jgi:hypothetical protein
MPLTATFDPGHNHYPNENVYFFMNDRDRRVRCGVSELALEVFDPQFERSKEGRLLAFNKYRPHIESVASAKYDRGQMERDGRSVLVSARGYPGHVQAKPAGATITRIPQEPAVKREAEKVEHTTHRQAAAPVCELGSNPNNMAALSSRA